MARAPATARCRIMISLQRSRFGAGIASSDTGAQWQRPDPTSVKLPQSTRQELPVKPSSAFSVSWSTPYVSDSRARCRGAVGRRDRGSGHRFPPRMTACPVPGRPCRSGPAGRSLVVVLVAAQHHVGPGFVESLPQVPHILLAAVVGPELKRGGASRRACKSSVRFRSARSQLPARPGRSPPPAVGVESDDVPVAEVVAVPAFAGVARSCAEVPEVPLAPRAVLVIAGRRPRAVQKRPQVGP